MLILLPTSIQVRAVPTLAISTSAQSSNGQRHAKKHVWTMLRAAFNRCLNRVSITQQEVTKRNQNCLFCIFRWSSKYVLIIEVRMSVANLHTPAISPHCTPWHACLHPTYVYQDHVYYIYSMYVHMYVGHHLPDIYASLCISMHLYASLHLASPKWQRKAFHHFPARHANASIKSWKCWNWYCFYCLGFDLLCRYQ